MSKYLKLFNEDADYKAFKESEEYILPNVSYVEDINVVYYNPFEAKETRVVCTYNVTDTTSATQVCYQTSGFTSMEVDGVLQDSVTTEYTFDTVGEHAVKFELTDPTTIGDMAFAYCSGLTSIVIPDSVTYIGNNAFRECSGLTSVHIGSGVTEIGRYAFYQCSGLTSINIPDSVTYIGSTAFYGCTSLPVEDNLCYVDTYLVGVANNSLSTYTIKAGTKWIGSKAFMHCSGLTSIVIPDSVTSIGDQAFGGCSGLTSVHIPDSVTSIGDQAFDGCSGLTSINIPDSVTTIGQYAFGSCSGLTSITCNAITAPTIFHSTFYNVKQGGVLKVPAGSDYSSWMSTSNYYLGKYNWTVEYI